MKSNLYYTPIRNFSDSSLTLRSLKRFSFVRFISKPAFKWSFFSFLIAALLIFLSLDDVKAQCTHTISLYDSYGDGWHGNNTLDVYVDGVLTLNDITLASGSGPANYTFNASTGSTIQITYVSGSWANECYYDVIDENGVYLIDNYYPNTSGTFNTIANCNCTPSGDETSYGLNSWIGYTYTSNGSGAFNTYLGYVTEDETFNRDMGTGEIEGLVTTIPCNNRSDDFAIRYKMIRDFPAGYYIFTLGGDDGVRLSIDGGSTWLISDWSDHSYRTNTSGSIFLDGTTNLIIEFYEDGGHAHVSFAYTFTPTEGDNINDPISLGTLTCNNVINETFNTSNFTNTQDNSSPDVFHSFTLTSEALVSINTCTGSDFDTYLRLFDSGQSQIYANDDACDLQSEIEETLPAGTYYIQTEGYNSNSGTAGLEVYIVPESPVISGQPSDASICEGDNINLSIVSNCGSCPCTYQWQVHNGSWNDIGGATSDTYNASPTSTTDYRCIVTNGGLTSTSDVATVTVSPYPTNVNAGSDLMVCSGGSVQLNGSADGTSVSFSWSPAASLDNANIANPNTSPTSATTYTMTASINGCSVQDDVYVDLYDGTWTGIEDNNWHNPNNWCNGVPSSTDDAVISTNATYMPEIHFVTANVRNLTVLAGASLEINSDKTLNIYGDFINQGTLSMANGNEAIVMQGNNININTNGNAVNHLHVQGSSTIVNIQNSFDVMGELNVQEGNLNLGNHTMQVAGNITIDGTLNAGTSTVVLNGTSVQTLNTNGNNSIFNNLTINNTTANLSEVVLDSDLHISGHLELTEGIIFTNIAAHKVKLLDGANSSNGNANSFVDGEVEKTGTTAFIYPVGDVANIGGSDRAIWAPIETDACTLSTISANYYYENPPYDWWYHSENMDASIDHVTDREYWDLSTNNATPAVSIYWTDNTDDLHSFGSTSGEMTPAFLASNMTIAHYNTSLNKWEDMGANIPTGTIYFDDGVIKTTTAFSSYSPITFASKNPTFTLPVELITFNANCYKDYVSINWTSASEINNDYYLIERSEDGKNWESIARVEGAGNSNTEIDYEVIDKNPLNGNNYYRLTQFDFDGKFETFKTVITTCDIEENELEIVIYPNPFKNELNVTAFNSNDSQSYTVRLLDISGKLILKREIQSVSNAFHIRLLPGDIKAGMYILEVLSESDTTRFKVQRM